MYDDRKKAQIVAAFKQDLTKLCKKYKLALSTHKRPYGTEVAITDLSYQVQLKAITWMDYAGG